MLLVSVPPVACCFLCGVWRSQGFGQQRRSPGCGALGPSNVVGAPGFPSSPRGCLSVICCVLFEKNGIPVVVAEDAVIQVVASNNDDNLFLVAPLRPHVWLVPIILAAPPGVCFLHLIMLVPFFLPLPRPSPPPTWFSFWSG